MDGSSLSLSVLCIQVLVGLSKATILFIVASGLTLILGVLRIPNLAHGSLYMIGAFTTYTLAMYFGASNHGFFLALLLAPLLVALIGLAMERGLFRFLYQRDHLMLLLFTFSFALVFGDLVKILWGSEYRSLAVPEIFQGSFTLLGMPFSRYNLFLLMLGPLFALGLWFFTNRTKLGKIARAASLDREMVGAVGINVNLVYSAVFVFACFLAGIGGALVAPTQNISQGMDQSIIIEIFLIVIIGGLGNVWGALLGSVIFGLTDAIGILLVPQFAIVFPYLVVIFVLLFRPKGLLKSTW